MGIDLSSYNSIETGLFVKLIIPNYGEDRFSTHANQITFVTDGNIINATAITTGMGYRITTVDDTDYTLIGSPDNNIGTDFIATGVGTGTGTVEEVDIYLPAGNLLSVSSVSTTMRASGAEITVSLSGVPPENVALIANEQIRSSTIEITRGFFNPTDHTLLNIPSNPMTKFKGVVSNISFTENWTNNILHVQVDLICSNIVTFMNKKINGRRTAQIDFPDSKDMDNVVAIDAANYNFGVP